MEQKNNLRQLYILQYLYEQTDENHPATNMDITEFLSSKGISVHRQTIPADIEVLCSFGFDIITVACYFVLQSNAYLKDTSQL